MLLLLYLLFVRLLSSGALVVGRIVSSELLLLVQLIRRLLFDHIFSSWVRYQFWVTISPPLSLNGVVVD